MTADVADDADGAANGATAAVADEADVTVGDATAMVPLLSPQVCSETNCYSYCSLFFCAAAHDATTASRAVVADGAPAVAAADVADNTADADCS